jgi:DNA-binding MarR family transcriptional regulator
MDVVIDEDLAQVRRFDRLYERRINELQARALVHEVSWAQMLVLHELSAVPGGRSAAWLGWHMDFDRGYLCRVLKELCARELASVSISTRDRRLREYELTKYGMELAREIDAFHREEALLMLDFMNTDERRRLVDAMRTIEELWKRHPIRDFTQDWSSALRKRARYRPRRPG